MVALMMGLEYFCSRFSVLGIWYSVFGARFSGSLVGKHSNEFNWYKQIMYELWNNIEIETSWREKTKKFQWHYISEIWCQKIII